MSTTQFLPLPVGYNGYTELKQDNCYYVDKTAYLKTVLNYNCKVLLLTRPRRFGKSIFMSTLQAFLKLDSAKPGDTSFQKQCFQDTLIMRDHDFCKKFMGQYAVIFISLKDVNGDTFEDAYKMFADTVYGVIKNYKYLLNSSKLDEDDKGILKQLTDINYLEDRKNSQRLKNSLKFLANFLYKEYGKLPILLIDEYDVPLAKASYHDGVNASLYRNDQSFVADYHKRMVTLMSDFLGILKDENALQKTVITGCLKVAKNDIFTGVNNLVVNSVADEDDNLSGLIGFTKEETYRFLKDYGMDDLSQLVKDNYDGYRFFDKEMFCPWDVVNFIGKNKDFKQSGRLSQIKAGNYWLGTSSSSAIYEYLGYLNDTDTQQMQDLVDGKTISFTLNESMNYDSLSLHKANDFWSLLLHTGYLTVDWNATEQIEHNAVGEDNICVRIPNLEILECFIKNIKQLFNNELTNSNIPYKLIASLLQGRNEEISNLLFDLLQKYVSIRDSATKAPLENYYHGFMNGIFANCEAHICDYHSNYETGNGYADISFKAQRNTKAVIIEIKATAKESDMEELAERALTQIENKNYALPFLKLSKIKEIYAYAIVFCKKDCCVISKKIR